MNIYNQVKKALEKQGIIPEQSQVEIAVEGYKLGRRGYNFGSARQRDNEKIGGGFFVFRRGKKTGRIGIKNHAMPFEHPTYEAAKAEADRLMRENPGETFVVFGEVGK